MLTMKAPLSKELLLLLGISWGDLMLGWVSIGWRYLVTVEAWAWLMGMSKSHLVCLLPLTLLEVVLLHWRLEVILLHWLLKVALLNLLLKVILLHLLPVVALLYPLSKWMRTLGGISVVVGVYSGHSLERGWRRGWQV